MKDPRLTKWGLVWIIWISQFVNFIKRKENLLALVFKKHLKLISIISKMQINRKENSIIFVNFGLSSQLRVFSTMMGPLPLHFYLVESQVYEAYLLPWQHWKEVWGTWWSLFSCFLWTPCTPIWWAVHSGDCNLQLVILGIVLDYRFFSQLLPSTS